MGVRLRGDGQPQLVRLRGPISGRDGYAAPLFEWRSALERLRPTCGAFGSNENGTSRINSATATRRRGYPTRSGSLISGHKRGAALGEHVRASQGNILRISMLRAATELDAEHVHATSRDA
ncbi:hypothetical protein C8J57DRAFT_1255423 [Mycena rebaudengoi]|nr:hypothetical protein C8J57DRAFT_1255423 [Mycena rebaudengoi]